jgi:hypothetical protein
VTSTLTVLFQFSYFQPVHDHAVALGAGSRCIAFCKSLRKYFRFLIDLPIEHPGRRFKAGDRLSGAGHWSRAPLQRIYVITALACLDVIFITHILFFSMLFS